MLRRSDLWRRRLFQSIEGVLDEFITADVRASGHQQVAFRQLAHSVESSLSRPADGRNRPWCTMGLEVAV